ncbi:MAG: prepilin-type N-terminal cleavage/methylation domain-containing protein [Candidatus Omnitrophota bacterium]|jgi:prepilin-type N-terminal cleavage/methylation domain-containing protein
MNKNGVSLVEVLIAALILSLVLSSLAYVFIAGRRHIAHSRLRAQAIELARYYLTPLQMQVRQDEWSANCLGSNTGCSGLVNSTNISNVTYIPDITVYLNASGTHLSKVLLNISWNETAP